MPTDIPASARYGGPVRSFSFSGKKFALTGSFVDISRREIAEQIDAGGGILFDGMPDNTDFLVVGAEENDTPVFYEATLRIKNGAPLRLIPESMFLFMITPAEEPQGGGGESSMPAPAAKPSGSINAGGFWYRCGQRTAKLTTKIPPRFRRKRILLPLAAAVVLLIAFAPVFGRTENKTTNPDVDPLWVKFLNDPNDPTSINWYKYLDGRWVLSEKATFDFSLNNKFSTEKVKDSMSRIENRFLFVGKTIIAPDPETKEPMRISYSVEATGGLAIFALGKEDKQIKLMGMCNGLDSFCWRVNGVYVFYMREY